MAGGSYVFSVANKDDLALNRDERLSQVTNGHIK